MPFREQEELALWPDKPREECGVFGIFGHPRAAEVTYYGLLALQHRGQEAAGMTVSDGYHLRSHKGLGLLADVFSGEQLADMPGTAAIGHVRYSTAGANTLANAQPLSASTYRGPLALAHNGNLVNAQALRTWLERQGSLFQSTSDTEVVLHLVARAGRESLVEDVQNALSFVKGGYAFLFLSESQLVAARDPLGLRPLALGRLGDAWVVASESCAFETVGAEMVRDVAPGEVLVVDASGLHELSPALPTQRAQCTFEHIYFARPDSDIDGWNVHAVRKQLGRVLAEHHPAPGDIVVGVPDSSISAAVGFSEASGIPYEMGLVKNKYIARTFIQPAQELRDIGVRLKLSAVRSVVEGKRVVLIDDSIVRGTTSRRIVRMLREAGARAVHVRIASPPYRHPCHYGIDTSARGQLIAARLSVAETCREIEADSLEYLTVDELMSAFGLQAEQRYPFCNACFTGQYPTEVYEPAEGREQKHVGSVTTGASRAGRAETALVRAAVRGKETAAAELAAQPSAQSSGLAAVFSASEDPAEDQAAALQRPDTAGTVRVAGVEKRR